ncbi:hypothetical protein J2S00_003816 [Caldalkalibacillus uzonensis]|uniref:Uncharacterized protein n=1 Tax=Caldalkalibacillus uzonensis TaxID=353224 RepID=A0ABU0CXW0_9BACI|nr:hypothetical protein [Caldalkalibacillus uzonensis]
MSERLDKLFSLAYQGNRLVPDYLLERKRLPTVVQRPSLR